MVFLTAAFFWNLLLMAVGIYLLLHIYYKYFLFNYWKSRGVPSAEPVIFFGSFIEVFLQRICLGMFFQNLYNKLEGPYIGLYDFKNASLLLKDPELIKAVMIKDFAIFSDRGIANNSEYDPYGSRNLLAAPVMEWRIMRQKLTPLFTAGKLKYFVDSMEPVGDVLMKYIEARAGKPVRTREMLKKYSTEIFTKSAFGLTANCMEDENDPILRAAHSIWHYNYVRVIGVGAYLFAPLSIIKFLKLKVIPTDTSEFWIKVLRDVMDRRAGSNKQWNDLLEPLMEMMKVDPNFNDEDIMVHMFSFLAAGYETSSNTVSYSLYQLSHNQEIQKRLRTEIQEVLKRHDGKRTYECLQEMVYVEMVFNESLRMFPPFPIVFRQAKEDYTLPGTDLTLEAGTKVFIPLLGVHNDPKNFPNPEKFDPERFSKENKHKIHAGAYLPFGIGPRNCIGERFSRIFYKFTVVRLLTNYEILKAPGSSLDIKYDPKTFSMKPVDGFPVIFKPIQH